MSFRGSNSSLTSTLRRDASGLSSADANARAQEEGEPDPIRMQLHTDEYEGLPEPKRPVDLAAALPEYTLKKTLGEGAFAKVKQAVHKPSGVCVCVFVS